MSELRRRASPPLVAHRPGRGRRYAPQVQAAVVQYAQQRLGEGAGWKEIEMELGLRFETVRRWCVGVRKGRPLKRVEIVDSVAAGPSGLILTCPSGHRLEGLTLQDAIAALRALV